MIKIETKCFDLDQSLDCGQSFRWEKVDNKYIGVIKDRVLEVYKEGDFLYVSSNVEKDLEKVTRNYFDLDADYAKMEKYISAMDKEIAKCVKNSSGIHFLNQDFFEIIITFIISANNNIPRITKSIAKISEQYGKEVEYKNKKYYLFPTPQELKKASKEALREIGVGFRDKYILETTKMLEDVDLEELKKLSTTELKNELLKLKGVGPKVADCIMLFACGRKECFPVDVWIKRVMQNLYYDGKEIDNKKILEDAEKRYGMYAGIVQQHLYQNGRKGYIK